MLFIVRGLPGSGKSTIAKKLLRNGAVASHFETDMYFYQNGEYTFDRSKLREAHMWCQANVEKALKQGYNVVVSNTFIKKWEAEPYLEMCKSLNIDYVIIIATGRYDNIHGVPQEIIDRMRENWESF